MSRRRVLILGWVVVLGLSAVLPISAVFHGIVHLGPHPYTSRGASDQPIIAVGGDVILPHGSRSIVVDVLGNIVLSGTASDDLVTAGGRVYLQQNAHVQGDVLSMVGGIYMARGSSADGRLGGALHPWNGRSPASASLRGLLATNIRLGLAAGLALLLVGTCLTVVFPWQVVLISTTLRSAPVKSLAAGVLSLVTFVFLVVPLGLSLAGLPFALLLTGAGALAWLFGLTSAAVVLGRMLARGPSSLIWATAAGLVVMALGLSVPLVGALAVTLTGLTGAGALTVALLTRSRPSTPMP